MRAESDASQALPPVLARIRDAYPDCRSGRFVCLAAFESPEELELFRVAGEDPAGRTGDQPEISIRHARNETGAGSLRVRLGGAGTRLVFDGTQARQLTLIRDWKPYTLLLLSVFNPADAIDVRTTLTSGQERPLSWDLVARIQPGWNVVRIDLADAGDRIELDDVRRIEWSLAGGASEAELFFDDILLTNNRQNIAGSGAAEGELFVYRRGDALHIASLNRFDVAIRNGVIVRCGAAEGVNLAAGDGLGPWPVVRAFDADAGDPVKVIPAENTPFSRDSTATEQILESAPARVVVEYQRPLVGGDGAVRTRYVFYPNGRVYFRIHWPGDAAGAARGLALEAADAAGLGAVRGDSSAGGRGTFVLFTRRAAQQHDVLWAPSDPALAASAATQRRGEAGVIGVVAPWPESADEVAGLLVVWPTDLNGVPEAESLAGDYQLPARVTVRTGQLRTDVDGDLDGDGFNESEGCYEIQPSGGVARFSFDSQKRLRHNPLIRVHDVRGLRCWVYADGRVVEPLRRDGQDNLLVQLPRVSGGPLNVEVHAAAARPAPATQPASAPRWFR